MLFYELLPQGHTVTGSIYSSQLQKLASGVREKRPRRASVHLLHDNARPHVAKQTNEKMEQISWDTVSHPPYSPDLARSDYHLFRPLKAFLAKKIFTKFEEVEPEVSDFFDSQPLQFWEKGITDLPNRWDIVAINNGDYIILHNGLPPHSGVEVTLGVELRCTAEVHPPAGSPKLRRSSTHSTFRLLRIGSLAKSKPLLRFTTVLAKCRKVVH
ncbi:hypothetical protein RB195_018610 [Necator americanus]|uniref:Tc1-like transposase DDE domain-containing protein n=1 Tax=Necator americanus TaxID=51031 RepID=A0ABR1CAI6_NECAM